MDTRPLDVPGVLGELGDGASNWDGLPSGTDMGHVHLQVADVAAVERFYIDVLGFERMTTYPGASFLSAGGYHHHLGLNCWAGFGVPAPPVGAARLLSYALCLPTTTALDAVLERVRVAGVVPEERAEGWAVCDPSHNTVILTVRS